MTRNILAFIEHSFVATLVFLCTFWSRWLSPLLGHRCRFHPSCSCYTREALVRFGLFRGAILGSKRILRCHPFCQGGFDPLPKD